MLQSDGATWTEMDVRGRTGRTNGRTGRTWTDGADGTDGRGPTGQTDVFVGGRRLVSWAL